MHANMDAPRVDRYTLTCGALVCSATILLAVLTALLWRPAPAAAIGILDRSGDYIMLTMQLSSSNEGLVVTDAASKQTILYGFDINGKKLEIVNRLPLDRLRKPRAAKEDDSRRKP